MSQSSTGGGETVVTESRISVTACFPKNHMILWYRYWRDVKGDTFIWT